jgi:hypothetical protein
MGRVPFSFLNKAPELLQQGPKAVLFNDQLGTAKLWSKLNGTD